MLRCLDCPRTQSIAIGSATFCTRHAIEMFEGLGLSWKHRDAGEFRLKETWGHCTLKRALIETVRPIFWLWWEKIHARSLGSKKQIIAVESTNCARQLRWWIVKLLLNTGTMVGLE